MMLRFAGDDRPHGANSAVDANWTDDRVALLRAMWADGVSSAADIADALGLGRQAGRSAVIGKIHRLGLGRKSAAEISAARKLGKAKADEAKRAKSEQQRAKSAQEIAARRARAMAEGKAIIAKVEAAPKLTLIDNPGFVPPVEKPVDLYSHLRSERGYRDAVVALSRPATHEERQFHGS